MITPAISVLSAVEGLKVDRPVARPLSSCRSPRRSSSSSSRSSARAPAAVGRLFGPIMIVWFTAIAVLGSRGIAMHPEVLEALSPTYAARLPPGNGSTGFFSLAAVVLAITGVEALYADMGHFGRPAITRAWLLLVFPGLHPQLPRPGGLILDDPSHDQRAVLPADARRRPDPAGRPRHGGDRDRLAGGDLRAFSIAHQASQLGYLPRLRIVHTSEHDRSGRSTCRWINWLLLAAVLALVFSFQTSVALAFAFGMAVTATITITTILFFYIVRQRWQRPLWLGLLAAGGFLARGPRCSSGPT